MHSIVNIRIKDLSPPSATLVVLVMYLPLSGDVDSIGVVSFMFSSGQVQQQHRPKITSTGWSWWFQWLLWHKKGLLPTTSPSTDILILNQDGDD